MKKLIFILNIIFISSSYGITGIKFLNPEQTMYLDYQIEPYYSQGAFSLSLDDPKVMTPEEEKNLYYYLLKNFFDIKNLRFELSANPMPLLGVYLKKSQSNFYDKASFLDINLIKAATGGFPDPGAFSIFLGNNVILAKETPDGMVMTGSGLGGFLLNCGNYHIVNNMIVNDYWFEGEMKVKGAAFTDFGSITYSYRWGLRVHDNSDIENSIYIGMKRSHSDSSFKDWSIIKNTVFDFRMDFALKSKSITKLMAVVGKKYPSKDGKIIYALDFGAQWIGSAYSGELEERADTTGMSILIRPNISF